MAKSASPRRTNRVTGSTLLDTHRGLATSFLRALQSVPGGPEKRFTGLLTPRFGGIVPIFQFENDRLVGAITLERESVPDFCRRIIEAAYGRDYAVGVSDPEPDDAAEQAGE